MYYSEVVSAISICFISGSMGYLAHSLNRACVRVSSARPYEWMPMASTLIFTLVVGLTHFAGWVPVWIASLIASPIILLPPLTYCVTQNVCSAKPPLFSFEYICRLKDNLSDSALLQDFLIRYPKAKAYIYKNDHPNSSGGLILHNRERLDTPRPTHLEVTLDCPFTHKPGELAIGRESFRAYLARHKEEGSIIHVLPPKEWEAWLIGLEAKDWMKRLEDLDQDAPSYPNVAPYPYQLNLKNKPWEPISLK